MGNISGYALARARNNRRVVVIISASLIIAVLAVIAATFQAHAAPRVSLIPGKVSGLQRTGYTAGSNGTLLSANGGQADGNWVIDRVIRPAGRGGSTCQKALMVGGAIRDIPTTSANPVIPAMTIMEANGTAGAYRTVAGRIADGSIAYLGDSRKILDPDYGAPWRTVDPNARWIGQNRFGQAYSDTRCSDPTELTPADNPNSNIYVFKLRNGFTVDPSVNLSTIMFKLDTVVDNILTVMVNGQVVQSRLLGNGRAGCNNATTGYANSQEPGYDACARTVETRTVGGVFRSDRTNTLELHVQSSYSHTGLLIRSIEMTGELLPDWSITPTSTVSNITGTTSRTNAKPGDVITWTHGARNNGPDATDRAVTYRYENGTGFAAGSGATQAYDINSASGRVESTTSTYRVVAGDVGKTFCRATSATPRAWNNSSQITSGMACVSIPYSYTLTPTLTTDRGSIIETPSSVTVTPNVSNSGPTNSRPTQWQLTRTDITPGNNSSRPSGGQGAAAQEPCTFFAGTGSNCRVLQRGTTVFNADGGRTGDAINQATEQLQSLPVGTKICFSMSVQPVSSSSTNWSHAAPICLTVAKKPKVQVLGGDLIVGRATPYNPAATSKVVTSSSYSSSTSRYYGSWSEYAIIPSGTVTGMASGAMYVDGSTSSDLCSLSVLTISNNTGSGCQTNSIGRYVSGSMTPNIAGRFPVTSNIAGVSVDLNSLASARTYAVNNASINVSSSQPIGSDGAGKGKWIVINDPGATVTITSNITYANTPLSALDDIPQVVIIARNILIADSVTNVDAWLVAVGSGTDGYVNTCSSIPAGNPNGINANTCNQLLKINGPVLANKLYMYRTAGSGINAAIGDPAEVFNLRSDAYLWASSYTSSTGRLPTVSTKELPPRF